MATAEPVAWSYTRRPQDTPRDAVRFLVGQTSTNDTALLYDPELDFLLIQSPNIYFAAAQAAESLGAQYDRLATRKTVGSLTLDYSGRAKSLLDRAALLRRQGVLRAASPYIGGQSWSERLSEAANSDQVQPNFTIGMDDNHFIGSQAPVPFGSS